MPRFYLHLCNGDGFVEDDEGVELPDAAAARLQAIEGLRDMMASDLRGGALNIASYIEIEDENRQIVATVPFLEAVEVTTRQGTSPAR